MHDKEKPSVFLWYVDAINLYDHAMSQTAPVDEFQWVNGSQDVLKNLLLHTADDSNVSYIAYVDLNYPKMLHDMTNDYPWLQRKSRSNTNNSLLILKN